jgi:hypothetical protein
MKVEELINGKHISVNEERGVCYFRIKMREIRV